MTDQIGVITEQGDLGLGFDVLNEKEQALAEKVIIKEENGISTQLATTAVRFERITPEGYDLRLSYPVIPNNVATQILVMKGDNIKKSFYILNEKLLRFNIRKLTDKFEHYDRNLYYYDNEHLQNSNLETYLVLLRDKLFDLNEKLDAIRAKQRKPRASLQKKTN